MSGFKQTGYDHAYFMPLSSLQGAIYTYTGNSGNGGAVTKGAFAPAVWATSLTRYGYTAGTTGSGNTYLSSINGIGAGMLKDMGTTVVSSSRTFRKVQLIAPSLAGGVNGDRTTAGNYLTAYIELATGNAVATAAAPAPVAYLPGLL